MVVLCILLILAVVGSVLLYVICRHPNVLHPNVLWKPNSREVCNQWRESCILIRTISHTCSNTHKRVGQFIILILLWNCASHVRVKSAICSKWNYWRIYGVHSFIHSFIQSVLPSVIHLTVISMKNSNTNRNEFI